MIDRLFYKTRAKANLNGKWIIAALVAVVLMIATGEQVLRLDMYSNKSGSADWGSTGLNQAIQSLPTGNAILGNWDFSSLPFVSLFLIPIGLLILAAALALQAFLMGPLSLGAYQYFRQNDLGEGSQDLSQLLWAFRSPHYLNIVKVIFLRDIKLFGWFLLLVIPGIIKSYEYSMIPYLLSRDPALSAQEVFAKTRELTLGRKSALFVLDLSFIGWFILGSIPLGLGTPFVTAYSTQTKSGIFNDWIGDTKPLSV